MADATYKITAVNGNKEWTHNQHGAMVDFTIELDGLDGQHTLTQKPSTPAPQVGEELFGHAEPGGQWPSGDPRPPKFKKGQGSGFRQGPQGPRPEDPERSRRIVRQHSQEMALRYATIRQQQGKLPDTFALEDLFLIADKFDADAGNGKS